MRVTILMAMLLAACAGEEVNRANLHDQLTDCPEWASSAARPEFCERACQPKQAERAAGCTTATNPTTTDTRGCPFTSVIDGKSGCCVMVSDPAYRVLYFECS